LLFHYLKYASIPEKQPLLCDAELTSLFRLLSRSFFVCFRHATIIWKLIGSDFIVKPRVAQICHANIAYQIHGNHVRPISKTSRGYCDCNAKYFKSLQYKLTITLAIRLGCGRIARCKTEKSYSQQTVCSPQSIAC